MSETLPMKRGVILMAYGTPETPDQVEEYFTHIRGGRKPSSESVARLQERYERIGGRTPLLDITRAVARKLEEALNKGADPSSEVKVYIGMKHWHPYIADTLEQIVRDGITHLTAIVLAPHYSRMSVGGYHKALEEARQQLGSEIEITFVDRWHHQPEFVAMMSKFVSEALEKFERPVRQDVVVVFSAHSLPERIREWDDPYERELIESSRSVAQKAGLRNWRFAWQSEGETGEPWLGPDILDFLETLYGEGVRNVLQVPIGFVSDHLEIMWDIDIEAREKAEELGMILHRTSLPNDSPDFIDALAAVTREVHAGSEQKYRIKVPAHSGSR